MPRLTFDIPTRQETIDMTDCPKCGALRGFPCTQVRVVKRRTGDVPTHNERFKAARALKRDKSIGRGF